MAGRGQNLRNWGREMRVLVNQQALFGRVAATLLIDAVSRER